MRLIDNTAVEVALRSARRDAVPGLVGAATGA